MKRVTVLFPSAALACRPLAGVPAAARALRTAGEQGFEQCRIAVPGGWIPDSATLAAARRIAPAVSLVPLTWQTACHEHRPGDRVVEWHDLLAEPACTARARSGPHVFPETPGSAAAAAAQIGRAERCILRQTAKPGDGIVSRSINRPVSRALSLLLLRCWPGILPGHATFATAMLAAAMVAVLLLGGAAGLIAGALLFQAASIMDGVDGEIARATYRCTARGAALDSMVDAATNLGFIAGVSGNLWLQGESAAAIAGLIGLGAFALGLGIIAIRDRSEATGATFDAVKQRLSGRGSSLVRALTWLTMRDFFALALAVLILCGLAPVAIYAFLTFVCGWLVVVWVVMRRQA